MHEVANAELLEMKSKLARLEEEDAKKCAELEMQAEALAKRESLLKKERMEHEQALLDKAAASEAEKEALRAEWQNAIRSQELAMLTKQAELEKDSVEKDRLLAERDKLMKQREEEAKKNREEYSRSKAALEAEHEQSRKKLLGEKFALRDENEKLRKLLAEKEKELSHRMREWRSSQVNVDVATAKEKKLALEKAKKAKEEEQRKKARREEESKRKVVASQKPPKSKGSNGKPTLEELKKQHPDMALIFRSGKCHCPICSLMRKTEKREKMMEMNRVEAKADSYDVLAHIRQQLKKKRISANRLWNVMDNDNSKAVTMLEFKFGLSFFGIKCQGNNDEQVRKVFAMMDKANNANGLLEKMVFKAFLFSERVEKKIWSGREQTIPAVAPKRGNFTSYLNGFFK
eukprot:g14267.t1